MKIISVLSVFLVMTATVQAQLTVSSNGNVFVQRDSMTSNATLSVGMMPGATARNYDSYKMGIRTYSYNTVPSGKSVGIFGEAGHNYPTNDSYSIGVWGMGGGALPGRNYGVLGSIHTGQVGAGIYGTNRDDSYFTIIGNFAGYFYGPVHIVGSVYSTVGFSSPADMRLNENVENLADKGSTLEGLSTLNVLEYNLRLPQEGKERDKRRHYGLSADELKKIFPDLVTKEQDGTLAVNYVELVPILIRCIQELRDEIYELRSKEAKRDIDVEKMIVAK